MQVRYQAAPRSDTIIILRSTERARLGYGRSPTNDTPFQAAGAAASAPQNSHQLLELDPQLLHNLLALRYIGARLFAG
jgi:hypothetical protein